MEKKIIAAIILAICLFSIIGFASALTISSVSTSPNKVEPGKNIEVFINVENEADDKITDISIALRLDNVPFAPSDSSSEISFDEIKSDKSKEAEFELIALNDAKSGIYKIPVEIKYTEDTQLKVRNALIGITISSEPILGASIEDNLLLKGQENELTIKIVNKGLSDIKFLEVETESSTYYSTLSSKNIYIGDIDSDDFDTARFRIYFRETVPSRINFPVTLVYKNTLNKEYTETFNLDLNVYSREKAIELGLLKQSYTLYYIIGIVVLIIIYIIYRKIKKSRKLKVSA